MSENIPAHDHSAHKPAMAENAPSPEHVCIYAYASDIERLYKHGYHQVEGTPSEPGQFCIVGSDVAPGWGEYWYDLDVYELPDQPLQQLGWHT